MKTWFTSDAHFGHARIVGYCQRPFKSLYQMEETIITRWNDRVKKDDTVIFLGDFCFKTGVQGGGKPWQHYRDQLNGNIVFIKGNHDGANSLNTHIRSLICEFGDDVVYCVHDPFHYSMQCELNLVGHVHEKWRVKRIKDPNGRIITLFNVGVDVNSFSPIDINEIRAEIERSKNDSIGVFYEQLDLLQELQD